MAILVILAAAVVPVLIQQLSQLAAFLCYRWFSEVAVPKLQSQLSLSQLHCRLSIGKPACRALAVRWASHWRGRSESNDVEPVVAGILNLALIPVVAFI